MRRGLIDQVRLRYAVLRTVYIDSCPDVDFFIFDVELCLIDCDRLPSVAVRLKEVFESMIPVADRNVTAVNEQFDPTKRQPHMVHESGEDTPLSRRFLAGNSLFFSCLLDNVVEHH